MMMAEAQTEQTSLTLHSLPSEPDCYGSTGTSFSEGSAAMDLCVKTETDDLDISHPAYCTEVQGFSAGEMDSELHLDTDHIKSEIVIVNIKEDSADLQLCSNTEVFCSPSQQLNSSISLFSKQCKSETGEVKTEQHCHFQESSGTDKKVYEVVHNVIKKEYIDTQGHELSHIPCPLSRQYKSEMQEVKLEQRFQVERSLTAKIAANEAASQGIKEDLPDLQVNEFNSIPDSLTVCHCMSETGEVKVEQQSQLQEPSGLEKKVNEVAHYGIKEECVDTHVHKLTSFPAVLSKQCKSEMGELKVQQHTQVVGSSRIETAVSEAIGEVLEENSVQLEDSFITRDVIETKGDLGPPVELGTNGMADKTSEQQCHEGVQPCQCLKCGKVFKCQSNLKNLLHTSSHDKHCYMQCGNSSQNCYLKIHKCIHSDKKPYKCSQCGKSFSHGNTLKRHQRIHANEKPYKCSQCEKSFSYGGHLKEHLRVHSGEKPYKCNDCGKCFSQGNTLKRHQLVHSGEKPHKCNDCGKSFSRGYTLKLHQSVHSGEKPYKCSECGKSFTHGNTLKLHQRVHASEKPYKCGQCGKSFSYGGHLKEHQRIHSGEKPYTCNDCGKSFSQGNALKRHQRIHSREKQYKCSKCGKSFSHGDKLKLHQRVHVSEKPYKCSQCGKCFSYGGHLEQHQRVHSGEKPYECSDCGKCFSQRSTLKRHQRAHSGEKPYKCSQCGKRFVLLQYLKTHERTHGRI